MKSEKENFKTPGLNGDDDVEIIPLKNGDSITGNVNQAISRVIDTGKPVALTSSSRGDIEQFLFLVEPDALESFSHEGYEDYVTRYVSEGVYSQEPPTTDLYQKNEVSVIMQKYIKSLEDVENKDNLIEWILKFYTDCSNYEGEESRLMSLQFMDVNRMAQEKLLDLDKSLLKMDTKICPDDCTFEFYSDYILAIWIQRCHTVGTISYFQSNYVSQWKHKKEDGPFDKDRHLDTYKSGTTFQSEEEAILVLKNSGMDTVKEVILSKKGKIQGIKAEEGKSLSNLGIIDDKYVNIENVKYVYFGYRIEAVEGKSLTNLENIHEDFKGIGSVGLVEINPLNRPERFLYAQKGSTLTGLKNINPQFSEIDNAVMIEFENRKISSHREGDKNNSEYLNGLAEVDERLADISINRIYFDKAWQNIEGIFCDKGKFDNPQDLLSSFRSDLKISEDKNPTEIYGLDFDSEIYYPKDGFFYTCETVTGDSHLGQDAEELNCNGTPSQQRDYLKSLGITGEVGISVDSYGRFRVHRRILNEEKIMLDSGITIGDSEDKLLKSFVGVKNINSLKLEWKYDNDDNSILSLQRIGLQKGSQFSLQDLKRILEVYSPAAFNKIPERYRDGITFLKFDGYQIVYKVGDDRAEYFINLEN